MKRHVDQDNSRRICRVPQDRLHDDRRRCPHVPAPRAGHDLGPVLLHRLTGAIESALGMLMFGWSTALPFEILHRADREPQA
jgi:hypothetical protein